MAEKTFPDFFANAGKEATSETAEFQLALHQVEMLRKMISFQIQIDFEEAEFWGMKSGLLIIGIPTNMALFIMVWPHLEPSFGPIFAIG